MIGVANNIKQLVDRLSDMDEQLRASRREAETASAENHKIKESSQEHEKRLDDLMERMRNGATKARDSSGHIFSAIRELTDLTAQVGSGVDLQRDRMTETATAMNEMTSTVVEIARNAADASRNAESSKENATTGASGVREAVGSIQTVQGRILNLKDSMAQLGDQATSIGQIIGVINDIADQTNLLALNAAIEAARAGDAGRGFAVVADEVRKLAEKTMTATKEVEEAVQRIQSHALKNVDAVDKAAEEITSSAEVATRSGEYMDTIVNIVEDTALQVDSIATASEEQSQVSEEINRAILDVTEVSQKTAEDMEQASHALVEISSLVEDLDNVIRGLADGSQASGGGDLFMAWNKGLSVGVERIDKQHMVLVEMINELYTAMRQRRSNEVLLKILEGMADYAVKHFKVEETLFDRYGYPEREAHKKIHVAFVDKVLHFRDELSSGSARVTLDVMRFLKDWLIDHIQGTDKKYGPFLNEHGVV